MWDVGMDVHEAAGLDSLSPLVNVGHNDELKDVDLGGNILHEIECVVRKLLIATKNLECEDF